MVGFASLMAGGAPALRVAVTPTSATGTGSLSQVTSNTVTGTPSNGTAPYTYEWTVTPTSEYSITALSPNSASTAFRATGLPLEGGTATGTANLKVTDNLGNIAFSQTVNISLTRT